MKMCSFSHQVNFGFIIISYRFIPVFILCRRWHMRIDSIHVSPLSTILRIRTQPRTTHTHVLSYTSFPARKKASSELVSFLPFTFCFSDIIASAYSPQMDQKMRGYVQPGWQSWEQEMTIVATVLFVAFGQRSRFDEWNVSWDTENCTGTSNRAM